MFCAISGVVPEEPVVSKTTGFLYEKRLILKHLDASGGKCPESGQDMSADDLIGVKVSGPTIRPIPSASASLPGLLVQMQNEWDAVMLEVHRLKVELHSTRQELAQALYQYDAATRVIVKLQREHAQPQPPANGVTERHDDHMDLGKGNNSHDQDHHEPMEDVATIPPQLAAKMQERSAELTTARKSRRKDSLTTAEQMSKFSETKRFEVPKEAEPIGVSVLARPAASDMLTAGFTDGGLRSVENNSFGPLWAANPHAAAITTIEFGTSSSNALTSSSDGVVAFWNGKSVTELRAVKDPDLTGTQMHRLNPLLLTSVGRGDLKIADIEEDTIVAIGRGDQRANTLALHVDGLLAGTGGVNGTVSIWDLTSMQIATTLTHPGHSGDTTCLEFSENGYYLVSSSQDTVFLWDMRKQKVVKSMTCATGVVKCMSLDITGSLLAIAGQTGSEIAETKKLRSVWSASGQDTTSCCWGPNGSWLAAGNENANMFVYGTPS